MFKNPFYLLLFLSMLATGCQPRTEVIKAQVYFSGVVDSIKVFPAGQSVAGDFMFDPLSGKDKIWTLNYTAPLELDLHTGTWTPLSDIYHERLSAPLHGEPIWKDSLTNEVFIINFNQGLVHLTCDSCPVNFYPIRAVQCVLNAEDQILMGTAGGLYTVDKQNKSILKVPGFPMTWINYIRAVSEDSLFTNNGYFPYRLKNPSRMIHFTKDAGGVYNNPFIEMLPHSEQARQYRLHYSGNIPFMYSSARLFFQDSAKTVFEIVNRPPGQLRHIKTDSAYIYLMYDNAFVILNKSVAMRNAVVFDVVNYDHNRKRIQQEMYSLHSNSLDTFLLQYQHLLQDSLIQSTPEFSQQFEESVANYFIYTWREKDISILESAIQKRGLPPDLEKYAILSVCMKYVKMGVLDKIPEYNTLLNERYPDFEYAGVQHVLGCVMAAKKSLDSLKAMKLDEDEYWFKEAGLKEKLVQCGWTGDTYYDYSIVIENYNKILSKYPFGPYGDNAAFYFISQMQYGDEGDQYSKEQIDACNTFLNTYPHSELKLNARWLLARNYNAYSGDQDSVIFMKERALDELMKIDQREVKDTNLLREINYFKADVLNRIGSLCFEIFLYPQKTDYKSDEEIKVSVRLKNITSTARSIRMFKNGPGWISVVRPTDQTTFMTASEPMDTTTQLVKVMPNDTLFQEISITRTARHWKDGGIGRYVLNQAGEYYLSARNPAQTIFSNEISIYVYD